jgi:hypothetical protein
VKRRLRALSPRLLPVRGAVVKAFYHSLDAPEDAFVVASELARDLPRVERLGVALLNLRSCDDVVRRDDVLNVEHRDAPARGSEALARADVDAAQDSAILFVSDVDEMPAGLTPVREDEERASVFADERVDYLALGRARKALAREPRVDDVNSKLPRPLTHGPRFVV